ncbi:MAG: LysR family transcriptional regulator [Rhizobiaceae bacterium]|nr:LysR family transcriptional regulator [Rhizobiaceae bacterium]
MDKADDMLLVIEIAETGSFTKAGLRVGMPKSTVSQRMAQLEARLGLRLFNRSTRKLSLTSAGQIYLEHCRRVRAEVMSANMAMANLKEQPVGTLTITCPEVTATYFMPTFLGGFMKQFPGVSIALLATNRHLDLIRDRVDFAFRVGPVPNQGFIIRRLSSIRRVLVAAPDYLAAAGTILEPSELDRHRRLLHDALPEWKLNSGTHEIVLKPPAAVTSDSLGFLLQMCLGGHGVALLPAYVCQSALASGRLVNVLPDWSLEPHDLTLVFPQRDNQSKAQAAFRAYADGHDFSSLATGRGTA